jgi:AraC-like DNA-binding protein
MTDLLSGGFVAVRLHRPPLVVNAGAAVHGNTGAEETFLVPDLWQAHIYAYSGELVLGGLTHQIRPGKVSLVPPGEPVTFRYRGRSEHLYVHLRLSGSGEAHQVPVMQDSGASAESLSANFRQAIAAAPTRPQQASAELWAALWRIARLDQPGTATAHPVVLRAMDYIETHLNEPLSIPGIARFADVSHNHLTRLFRAETGDTVVAHLRRRRMARAEHLLRHSTLPIPAVADAVGIKDLQAFNKTCRRELGASPRAVRSGPVGAGGWS